MLSVYAFVPLPPAPFNLNLSQIYKDKMGLYEVQTLHLHNHVSDHKSFQRGGPCQRPPLSFSTLEPPKSPPTCS